MSTDPGHPTGSLLGFLHDLSQFCENLSSGGAGDRLTIVLNCSSLSDGFPIKH